MYVGGPGFTIDDKKNMYADTLSHEIAEMVVDPTGVIQKSAINVGGIVGMMGIYFDINDKYVGYKYGSDQTPPSNYAYLICPIVKPDFIGAGVTIQWSPVFTNQLEVS